MNSAPRPNPKRRSARPQPLRFALRPIACCVMLACTDTVWANPTGASLAAGAATFNTSGSTLQITNSPGAIIHWQGFSIGANEITRFTQQSASSAVLNRVVGADISRIQGQLLSNGRVFLINPAGIIIGAGGMIDTAGFVGSTLNMQNADFLAGKLKFQGDASSGGIVNQGYIKAGPGGHIILVAPNIQNSGVLHTEGGQLILAAGQKLTIGSVDLEDVQFEIQAPADSVVNIGKLLADGGAVGVFAGTLRHSGDIRASALTRDAAGHIVLKARSDVTIAAGSTTDANGKNGGNVTIQSQTGATLVSGAVTATGSAGRGGDVRILGNRVGLIDGATVNASGETGGGAILLGGDYQGRNPQVMNAWRTFVGSGATLRADAIGSGDGGKVIVWADDIARLNGSISARGGARGGDGGFVETSGKRVLLVGESARVDVGAPAGRGGTWLLDPVDIRVANGGLATADDVDEFGDVTATEPATVSPATLANFTMGAITLQAENDITFASPLVTTASGNNEALIAQAGRSIFVNADITSNNDITLTANDSTLTAAQAAFRGPGPAELTMAAGTTINAGAGIIRLLMDQGANAGAASGNVTLANLTAAHVSVAHRGPTANGSILRAANSGGVVPVITVGNNGNVHLQIEAAAGGASSSIGTDAAPIQITAGAGTAILESHYRAGGAGIFVDSASNLQIGGATTVFGGAVKGVQTLSAGGVVPAGPIRVTSTGTLTQQALGAAPNAATCGASPGGGAAVGGPVCAGDTDNLVNQNFALGTHSITLRAADMTLQAPINGSDISLLPRAGIGIDLGSNAVGGGTLSLAQAELNQITATTSLRIGEGASGNMTFVGPVTTPGSKPVTFQTGGTMTTTQAAGNTDITAATATSDIQLTAGGAIGNTGPGAGGRLKLNTSVGSITRFNSSGGSIYAEQTVGDLTFLRWIYSSSGSPQFEYATTNGNILLTSGGSFGAGQFNFITGGANTDIIFSGVPAGAYGAASLMLNPVRMTQFTADTQTFDTPVATSKPIVFAGGSAIFNQALTTSTATGTLTINGGTATFNASPVIAAATTLTGGTLGGSASVTLTNPFNWSGGTVSGSGAGAFRTDNVTTISGAATKTLTSRTWNNFGTVDWGGSGNILLSDAAAIINNKLNAVWNIATTTQVSDMTGPGTFTNELGGVVNANAPFVGPGAPLSSNSIHPARVNHAGTLNINQGDIDYDNASTVTFSGIVNFANGTRIKSYNGPGTTLNFNGATLNVPAGTATLEMDNFAMNVNNALTIPANMLLRQSASTLTVNAPLTFVNGAAYTLSAGTLAGAFPVTVNGGLTWTGGTISNTNGVTVTGTTTINAAGAPQLSGSLSTGVLDMSAGTLGIASSGVLTLTGPGTSSLSGATINNAGRVNYNTPGDDLLINTGAVFNNQLGGTFDIQGDIFARSTVGPGAFNNAGTVLKSGGTAAGSGGFSGTLPLTNTGTLTAQTGTLQYAGNNNAFNDGTVFNGAGSNLVTGNSTFTTAGVTPITSTNLILGGAGATYGGSAAIGGTVIWTDGTVTGNLTNPIGAGNIWNLNGPLQKTILGGAGMRFDNAGTMNLNGGSLMLAGDADFLNRGRFNIAGDFDIRNTGAVTFTNNAGSNLTKTGGLGVSQIGSDALFSFSSGPGFGAGGTITVMSPPAGVPGTPTLQMNGTFVGNTNFGDITLQANTAFIAGSSFATNGGGIRIFDNAVFTTTANPFTNTLLVFLTNGTFSTNNNPFINTGRFALVQGTGNVNVGTSTFTDNARVVPGQSPGALVISGNYSQGPTGTLSIELGGTTPGSQYDQLRVLGNVSLGGTLNVAFCCGFPGAAGSTYNIIATSVPNGITGNFSTINPPAGTTLANATTSSAYTLSQAGGGSSGSSSSSSSVPMQFTNEVVTLNEQQAQGRTAADQEQPFLGQKKQALSLSCGPGTF